MISVLIIYTYCWIFLVLHTAIKLLFVNLMPPESLQGDETFVRFRFLYRSIGSDPSASIALLTIWILKFVTQSPKNRNIQLHTWCHRATSSFFLLWVFITVVNFPFYNYINFTIYFISTNTFTIDINTQIYAFYLSLHFYSIILYGLVSINEFLLASTLIFKGRAKLVSNLMCLFFYNCWGVVFTATNFSAWYKPIEPLNMWHAGNQSTSDEPIVA